MRNTTPSRASCFLFEEMDHENHQAFWLPVFFLLTLSYTFAGVAGAWQLWKTDGVARMAILWLLLAAFLILPRWIYMATLENTEPRYVVEFFPFLRMCKEIKVATQCLSLGRIT